MKIDMSCDSHMSLRWFVDSPAAGEPGCLCSYCGERIEATPEGQQELEEVNADEGEPIRMWSGSLEMRFHARCLNDCLSLGLLDFSR